MRTFLFISEFGDSVGIANKLIEAGDTVHLYMNSSEEVPLFKQGFFDPSVLRKLCLLNPDLVIFDTNFDAAVMAKIEFEKQGIPVYGASLLSRSISKHPEYLMKILALNKIETLGIPKDSIPVTYSIIMNGKKRLSSSLYFEYKKLMNDNIGPQAYMGCIGYHKNLERFDSYLSDLVHSIQKSGFTGKLDMMVRIKDGSLWMDGMSFYFNHNIYSLFENMTNSISDFFYGVSLNQDVPITHRSPWTSQVTCGIPPFPYNFVFNNESIGVVGLNPSNTKHIWMNDTPNLGNLMAITSRGDYIRECKRRVYRTLSNVNAVNLMYRTDIGNDAVDVFRRLSTWGWLDLDEEDILEPFQKSTDTGNLSRESSTQISLSKR